MGQDFNRISEHEDKKVINEGDTYVIEVPMTDENGDTITITDVNMKLHIDGESTIVNGRDGTVDTGVDFTTTVGTAQITLSEADNTIADATGAAARGVEPRRCLLDIEYSGGQQSFAILYDILYSPVSVV